MAGVSTYAQHQTAKAQAKAIGVQQEHERIEAQEAAEEEIGQRIRAARESRARARVAAGESGVGGASFAAAINQSLQDQDTTVALAAKNVAFAQRGIDDRANTALSGIRSPSALEAGLSIASAGVQGYSTGLSLKSKMKE
jgi:Fe-S cluster assembly iron-binding protein IscA